MNRPAQPTHNSPLKIAYITRQRTSWTLALRPKKKMGGFGTVFLMGLGVSSTISPARGVAGVGLREERFLER